MIPHPGVEDDDHFADDGDDCDLSGLAVCSQLCMERLDARIEADGGQGVESVANGRFLPPAIIRLPRIWSLSRLSGATQTSFAICPLSMLPSSGQSCQQEAGRAQTDGLQRHQNRHPVGQGRICLEAGRHFV